MVSEVIPVEGRSGTRVVILGSNFVNSPNLKAKIGDTIVPIQVLIVLTARLTTEINCRGAEQFHEQGALIFVVPVMSNPAPLAVRVSNDSIHFSETKTYFTYVV